MEGECWPNQQQVRQCPQMLGQSNQVDHFLCNPSMWGGVQTLGKALQPVPWSGKLLLPHQPFVQGC